MEISGCTIQLILGELNGECSSSSEVLVEPSSGSPPIILCVAWTLSPVLAGKVILQVMNVSPSPIKLYKGMKLGEATPRHNVLLVDDHVAATQKYGLQATDDLTPPEKTQLQDLLIQFAGLFTTKGDPVGRTQTVKHSIPTEGCPIRQPLRR